MSKTIYEKWRELLDAPEDSNVHISNFFLSLNAATKLYLGINQDSQFIFVEFDKSILNNVSFPELKGLEIEVCLEPSIDGSKEYVKIKNKTTNVDLFIAFSSSLYDLLIDTVDYYSAFISINLVIKEYMDFFSNEKKGLSLKEEQGLIAELLELSHLIDIKGENVVKCWMGPSRNKRDFLFEENALEVKSTLGQVDSSIQISNEAQLDCSIPANISSLFLKVYILEKVEQGIDVVSCANTIMTKLNNLANRNLFIVNLLKLKVDLSSYKCKGAFSVQESFQYHISPSFPKISKDSLPNGIFSVKYRIHLDAIKPFAISEEDLYGQL